MINLTAVANMKESNFKIIDFAWSFYAKFCKDGFKDKFAKALVEIYKYPKKNEYFHARFLPTINL